MRDPMSWAVPVFRAFGIPVKVHLFFIIISLGLFFRQVLAKDNPIWWGDVLGFTIVLLFLIVLLHEFGHCFGARYVGGEAKEVLMWPLGGLAYVDVPHTPRANFIATAAGPLVNVLICIVCALGLASAGFIPSFNPIANPYVGEMHNVRDGKDYTSPYGLKVYKQGTAEPMPEQAIYDALSKSQERGFRTWVVWKPETAEATATSLGADRALAPVWAVWLNRAFYLSWILLLFNLIPAYPLDGGRLFQCLVWARTDYRKGVVYASYTGFGVAVVFLIVSITWNEALFMGLALFMLYAASMQLHSLDSEEGPFGYDFSAGYTSLERDDEPPPKPKKVGWFTRWRQARRARKLAREAEQRQQDEARMDQLLEKIAQHGKNSLTDEERRFLERVSARKRNLS
ncbi:MAG TPA: site-2 protease family protein [Gemmataceae bacterium]|nr:site-2 protease family protein [Gemmataceae bacterium]